MVLHVHNVCAEMSIIYTSQDLSSPACASVNLQNVVIFRTNHWPHYIWLAGLAGCICSVLPRLMRRLGALIGEGHVPTYVVY